MGMDLTHEDVKKIIALVDEAQSLDEIEIVYDGFHLRVCRNGNGGGGRAFEKSAAPGVAAASPGAEAKTPPPGPAPSASTPAAERGEPGLADGEIAVRAPMLGTFFRCPSPGQPPFVEVGQRVSADDTVCLIEVMKLFSSIRASVDGVVTRILVENGSMVEFNQPIIAIAPIAAA